MTASDPELPESPPKEEGLYSHAIQKVNIPAGGLKSEEPSNHLVGLLGPYYRYTKFEPEEILSKGTTLCPNCSSKLVPFFEQPFDFNSCPCQCAECGLAFRVLFESSDK